MTIRTPAATELPPTQPAVPVEHGVGSGPGTTIEQNVPEAAANGSTRRGIADRHRAAQAASMRDADPTAVQDMSAAQQFRSVPETMWSNVSRILGLVSGDTAVQAVVNGFTLSRDRLVDAEQRRRFQETIAPRMINAAVHLNNPLEASATFDLAYDELIGISVLGPLWRDERITEILVDGWDKVVIERDGQLIQTPIKFRDHGHATKTARDLASKLSDRALTPANPLVTAQLPGARVNFAIGSIVRSGLSISLRKFRDMMGIDDLVKFGALNADMAEFLHQSVLARATVLVSGGTGTGKTTQINALSSWIPDNERVVTIEDAFELQLSNRNVVSLQTKERASADDEVLISQEMLLVNALRMRPDRIVVGEIREGRGAYVMLQAANTGHDGTMTTIHAQSPSVALNERLADLVMEVNPSSSDVVRRTVARAIDLVVQVTRRRGRRFISEIAVVDRSCFHDGMIQPEPVFVGDIDAEGNITFRHVGGVRPDTALGMKLAEVGFDVKVWEPAR